MLALRYVVGMIVSLWPARYRRWYSSDFELCGAALLPGLAQYLACVSLLVVRYVHDLQQSLEGLGATAVAKGQVEVLAFPAVQYGLGFFALVRFVLNPLSLLLSYYLALEGLVRFAAAAVTHEVVVTMPLYLLDLGNERLTRRATHAIAA